MAVQPAQKKTAGDVSPAVPVNQNGELPVSTATAVSTTTAAVEAAATTTAVEAAATATTVEATTTAEARAAMEAAAAYAATVEAASSAYATPVEATGAAAGECVAATGIAGWTVVKVVSGSGVSNSAAIAVVISRVAIVAAAAVVSTATVVTAATVVSTATVVTVIPGAGADKEATDEPARAIEAIGRAGVRIIRVVAPGADRSRVPITVISVSSVTVSSVTDTDSHTYLGVSRSRHQRCGNYQRSEQQKISEKLHFEPPRQGIMLRNQPLWRYFEHPCLSSGATT
jgi:hypothetical protein